MTEIPVVTIDGPSGCGKGTVSQLLATRLQWHFLDSGVMYRVLALAAEREQISVQHVDELVQLAEDLAISFDDRELPAKIFLAGEEITLAIRSENCSQQASIISVIPAVRDALNKQMRDCRRVPGLITDGRDMGTVVFPDATLKFYLDADPTIRAERRYRQLQEKGINVNLARVFEDIAERDQRDSKRDVAPLRPADDAIIVDTSNMSAQEVFQYLYDIVRAKIAI